MERQDGKYPDPKNLGAYGKWTPEMSKGQQNMSQLWAHGEVFARMVGGRIDQSRFVASWRTLGILDGPTLPNRA